MQKLKGNITALATEDISQGCLVIPVFCMRDSSYLTPSAKGIHQPHEVSGSVKWKQPVDESEARDVEVKVACLPERKQPAAKDKTMAPDYNQRTDNHPFWHIRRSNCVGEFNCAVVGVEVKVINTSPWKELRTDFYEPSPGVLDFCVTVPCIVNTEKLAGGVEIVVKWEKKVEQEADNKKRKVLDAFTWGAPSNKKPKK